MNFRAPIKLTSLFTCLLCLCYSGTAISGYKAFLDPRSMAMGGTGVASSTKFNASSHNPALIAFNRGSKPDKIYISSSLGTRELYNEHLNRDIIDYGSSGEVANFINSVNDLNVTEAKANAAILKNYMKDLGQSSYRSDELSAFNLLVDTDPLTINVFTRREIREMILITNDAPHLVDKVIGTMEGLDGFNQELSETEKFVDASLLVNSTYLEISEFGATVATTEVYDYNMPFSWGFTPKLIQFDASHRTTAIKNYDVNQPVNEHSSDSNLEWNLDVGFAILLTNDFLKEEFGLDGDWLEGEWIFGMSGMNLFPTDIATYSPARSNEGYPRSRPAIQALYQIGVAHYLEKYMLTMDIELTEDENFDFEGNTRFLSFGGEYYWRDDFHLRAGFRYNMAATDGAAKEKSTLTAGFLYQPHGFSIETAAMISDVEVGGSVGFGLAF